MGLKWRLFTLDLVLDSDVTWD